MRPRKTKELESSLKKKGFVPSERNHTYLVLYHGSKKTSIFTKVSHSIREYGDDLLTQMARQLNLTKPEFEQLVDCPMTHERLVGLLLSRGKIRE